MQVNKYFTIIFGGDKPIPMQVGFINKANGQPEANAMEAIQMVGEHAIPNFSTIWAIDEIDSKTKKYTGKVTPLKWGADGGGPVEIRYLKSCPCISKRYQEQEKFTVRDEDSEISLEVGLNEFDEQIVPKLVLMLKLHTYNGSNESRDPMNQNIRFTNYEPEKVMGIQAIEVEFRQKAENVVLDARYARRNLEVLAVIFDLDRKSADDIIFNQMMAYTQKPVKFWEIINAKKKEFEIVLQKSLEMGLIDMGMPTKVMLQIKGTKDILMEEIEGDDNKTKVKYIIDHLITPDIYFGMDRLTAEMQKYETKALQ